MRTAFKNFMLTLSVLIAGITAHASEIQPVDQVDLSRYAGTWFQIARNPVAFELGCVCSRQVLTATPAGQVAVLNTCNFIKPTGRLLKIEGLATVVNAPANSKLEVDFGLPWKGDYWVIAIDPAYRYAVVTDRHAYSLYILSKTPSLDDALYAQAVSEAARQVDTSKLKRTSQESCTYP